MTDLSTTYLGLPIKSPLVPSASPLMHRLHNIREMEECGAGAIVLHSLFEEQIVQEAQALDFFLEHGAQSYAEAMTYFPEFEFYQIGSDGYLQHLQRVKKAVSIPVIASLNGHSPGGWTAYARRMQEAGADALELNMYYVAADPSLSAADVEKTYLDLLSAVCSTVTIPVAVKLGDNFTCFANFARQVGQAGARGLVIFNRFYQPDFDLESMRVVPAVPLSTSTELLTRLRWTALLSGRVPCDLAVTGGVHTGHDVLKCLAAGAQVAMTTSALLKHGVPHVRLMLREMASWLTEHEYVSVDQMRGSMAQRHVDNPAELERANYMKVLRRIPASGVCHL